jgi:hypothetical protein
MERDDDTKLDGIRKSKLRSGLKEARERAASHGNALLDEAASCELPALEALRRKSEELRVRRARRSFPAVLPRTSDQADERCC